MRVYWNDRQNRRAVLEAAAFLGVCAVLFLLLAFSAFAQDGGVIVMAPMPIEAAKGFDWGAFFSGDLVKWVGGIAIGALSLWKGLDAYKKRVIQGFVQHAFWATEDAGRQKEGDDAFDKMAYALGALNKLLIGAGWGPASEKQVEGAKVMLSAMHAAQKAVASPKA